ncbi:hypothetical protein HOP50_03g22720 [Chloropicon primus]|uniref:Uncharacterized protein n=1 Tax=Chloropicon primus TaxID=1764295 RepID=A0A5B8MJB2_9CHLO|nr:hypothetical protein A3770_03p22730 [Chloropicon primus]UPQ98966.1 hypothetical protein HOP50_03g22720 [Chloropicon primus]|mmetsp:Transcript_5443/g.16497  ORF Transcript_5443/g.16497 Transcript_5443/m.16497 type:complete len:95 (-) Transcript_5443:1049-1333(-)|eukprot:QDZ19755.1 hypothetical protein A3770_03p22730 [Chloropicon primus]
MREEGRETTGTAHEEASVSSESFVSKIRKACVEWWRVLDAHMADLLGFNDSKYQWAVDEYFERKAEAEEEERKEEEKLHDQVNQLEQGRSVSTE